MSQQSRKRREPVAFANEQREEDQDSGGRPPHNLPATTSAPPLPETQLQVASYIEEISQQLAEMARGAKLDGLAYFIDMTRLEAEISRRALEARKAAMHLGQRDQTP